MYDLEDLKRTVARLGNKGEDGLTVLQFDLTDWLDDHPAGVAAIHAVRPTETMDDSYVVTGVAFNVDGTTLEWTVDDTDTEIAGKGLAELYLTDTGLVEIYPFHTYVEPAIGDTSGVLTNPRVLTTAGDLLYFSTEPTRLAIGASGYVLESSGTAPVWVSHDIGRYVSVPSGGSATGTVGDWSADADYIYACYATNTWVRCAKTTW